MKKLIILLLSFAPILALAQNAKKGTKTKPIPSLAASIAAGKAVYAAHCLSCHQADGGGVPSLNPPLIKTSYVLGDKITLIKIVLNGFKENIEIDGETFSNTMPAQATLTDQQIADVLTYVRNSFGNKATAVKATEVKKVRGK